MKEDILEENNESKEECVQEITQEINEKQTSEEQNNVGESTVLDQQEIQSKQEENEKKDKLHWYTKIIVVVSVLLLISVMVFSVIFALMNKNSDKIVEGIFVKGIEISGLTKEEATAKLNEIFTNHLKKDIVLKHNEFETAITPEQIETNFNITEAVDLAFSVGRTGKILKDNYDIINAKFAKIQINPAYSYNNELLSDFIVSVQGNLPDIVKQSSYSVDGEKLIIDKGQKGVEIQQEVLKKQISERINRLSDEEIIIKIPTKEQEPDVVNLQKIRDEIYKAPQDAYYTQNPFNVYPHINGIDFAISLEEAQNLLNNSDENTVTIPLKISVPKVTTNQIGTEAFPNLLATYSTTFSTKNTNRTTNIRLSSNKINGVVLMPGEQFSYNTVVGQRTAAAGYKSAAVYINGKVENGIGGGICQVSSTLYNTALRANLEIVKRSNHRFATGYVPLSTDATVSWGGPEFIFKNSRKHPIKIVSVVNGGKITVSIYGCKEEVEYDVVIQSQTLQTIPMKTVYRTNTSLPKGTTKKVQTGHAGYKSRAYRILKLNGTVVSKQLLSTDTYAQLETIIEQNP